MLVVRHTSALEARVQVRVEAHHSGGVGALLQHAPDGWGTVLFGSTPFTPRDGSPILYTVAGRSEDGREVVALLDEPLPSQLALLGGRRVQPRTSQCFEKPKVNPCEIRTHYLLPPRPTRELPPPPRRSGVKRPSVRTPRATGHDVRRSVSFPAACAACRRGARSAGLRRIQLQLQLQIQIQIQLPIQLQLQPQLQPQLQRPRGPQRQRPRCLNRPRGCTADGPRSWLGWLHARPDRAAAPAARRTARRGGANGGFRAGDAAARTQHCLSCRASPALPLPPLPRPLLSLGSSPTAAAAGARCRSRP